MSALAVNTPTEAPEHGRAAGCPPSWRLGSMEAVAEISINLPDDLVQQLRAAGHRNVSAYIAELVRNELDRKRLIAFLDELDAEFGPTDEAEVAECRAAFARTAAITRAMEKEAEAEAE